MGTPRTLGGVQNLPISLRKSMIFEFGPNVVRRPLHTRFRCPQGAPAEPKLGHWRQGPRSGGKSFWTPEPPRSTPLLTRTPDPWGRRIPKACGPCRRPQRVANFARDHLPFLLRHVPQWHCRTCAHGRRSSSQNRRSPRQADVRHTMKLGLSQGHVRAWTNRHPSPKKNEDPLDRLTRIAP